MLKSFKAKLSGLSWNVRRFGSFPRPPGSNDPNSSQYHMAVDWDYNCHNFHPIPVVIKKAKGVHVWDMEGKKYLDFLAGYAVVNQGHCNPKILKAMVQQAKTCHLTARAFYNDQLGVTSKYLSETFGYDKTLMMNTGVEAGESGLKLARRWAYVSKGVPADKATIIFAKKNFWGRTLAACASSDDPARYKNFGPFPKDMNFELINFDDIPALENMLNSNPNICAFMVEPIQGEAGVVYPQVGYLKKVKELCKKHNVLLMCDEVQTGLGRTGKLFASQWDEVKPDILLLGKALSGGFYPISAICADKHIMDVIGPGEHGSTFGGNPLACAIARRSVEVLFEDKMIENSYKLGLVMEKALRSIKKGFIKEVRAGKGLFAAVEFDESSKISAWNVALKLKDMGVLSKNTRDTVIRLAPPLTINEKQLNQGLEIFSKALNHF